MKKLILHIGMWKTGTTSIQETLFHNRVKLSKNSIYYSPNFANNIFFIPLFKKNYKDHVAVKSYPKNSAEIYESSCLELKNIKDSANEYDYGVFSSEFLLDLQKEEIEMLAVELRKISGNIKIICYVRSPILHFTSAVNEQVKQGHYPLEEAYNRHLKMNEYKKLEWWGEIFGSESICIRPFDKKQFYKEDLIADFFKTCEITMPENIIMKDQENKTLSHAGVLLADSLAKLYPSFSSQRGDTSFLNKIKGCAFRVSNELKILVHKENNNNIMYLKNKFGIEFDDYNIKQTKDIWSQDTIDSIASTLHEQSKLIKSLKHEKEYYKALFFTKDDNVVEAKKSYLLAIPLNKFEVFRDFANFLFNTGDYEGAILNANKAMEIDPSKTWLKTLIKNSQEKLNAPI